MNNLDKGFWLECVYESTRAPYNGALKISVD